MIDPLLARALVAWEAAPAATRAAGRVWYSDFRRASRAEARRLGVSLATYLGVFAATSPSNAYASNLAATRQVLGGRDPWMAAHAAAADIRDGARPTDALRGPKVSAFYRAMMGLPGRAVVDRHMARVLGDERLPATKGGYELASNALRQAAALVGEDPNEFQAVLWVGERGSGDP